MKEYERAVGRHYDDEGFAYERARLTRYRVEFLITVKALARWLPPPGTVCTDIGVGSGRYAELLAARGYKVHLVDVSAKLLEAAVERLRTKGYDERIAGAHLASATDLSALAGACSDVVLALGPLYHLLELSDRQCAVQEFRRLLRPNGILFAAGVNRLAFLRDAFIEQSKNGATMRERYMKFLTDGNLDPTIAPRIGFAHLSTAAEFEDLFTGSFDKIALWGVDSFAGRHQALLPELDRENARAWVDIVEATVAQPDAVNYADHFLYVGRPRGDGRDARRPSA